MSRGWHGVCSVASGVSGVGSGVRVVSGVVSGVSGGRVRGSGSGGSTSV